MNRSVKPVLLATTGGESYGAAGAFFLDVGISSTHYIARFWRLHESLVEMPRAAAPMSAPIQIPTDGRAFIIAGAAAEGSHSSTEVSLAEDEGRETRYPLDPNAVIAAAFKAAGLPVPEIPTAPPGATPRVAPGGGLEGRRNAPDGYVIPSPDQYGRHFRCTQPFPWCELRSEPDGLVLPGMSWSITAP